MLTPILDSSKNQPLYEQIYHYVKAEIENNNLTAHTKLPSKRVLAEYIKVSQMTVETAYAQLVAEGYLYTRPKSGYFVQPIEPLAPEMAKTSEAENIGIIRETQPPKAVAAYDFSTDYTETEGFPFSVWAKIMRETLNENHEMLLQAGNVQGDFDLRRAIAALLRSHRGITCRLDQIIVGAGTEYLLGLAVQLLGRNLSYAAENPGYPKIHKILQHNAAKTYVIPMGAQGIELEALRQSGANAVHVTPSHQFPLGIIMPVARRRQLLNWAEEVPGRYILEDDYDSEFRFDGKPIPALKTLDTKDRVIYFNTFAKSLAPSLRFGYMVLPDALLQRFYQELDFYSSTVSNFEQRALYRFLNNGHFERHLNRMRKSYRTKRDALVKALAVMDPQKRIEIYGSNSGLHILLKINNGMSERELIARAMAYDVRVYGLSEYSSSGNLYEWQDCIVLGYAGIPLEKIPVAVKLLAAAWLNN